MRKIAASQITEAVAKLSIDSCWYLGADIMASFRKNLATEASPTGRDILGQLIKNAEIAAEEGVAICQDCGLAVIFAEIGREVLIEGDFQAAVDDGVIKGYLEGYLRKSTCHPFTRANYGNNAPAIVHIKLVPGDKIKLTLAPKGGGSENMSALKMFPPAAGKEGVKNFVVETVETAGPNPCPPIIVGVGIGSNFEGVALLAKEALLREVGLENPDPELARMEAELMTRINRLGIGPGGYGGTTTALAVHIKAAPCHIASLPVAVNMNCHAARHKTVEI